MLNLNEIQDESNGIYKDCEIDWLLLTVMEMQKEENDKLRSASHQLGTQCASLTASMPALKEILISNSQKADSAEKSNLRIDCSYKEFRANASVLGKSPGPGREREERANKME